MCLRSLDLRDTWSVSNYLPTPAAIDELAATAIAVGPDPQLNAVQWGALWRVVLGQNRWFFVNDNSAQTRPGLVQIQGQSAIPVFTDIEQAITFAQSGGRDANAVFASPPRDLLAAAAELEAGGVALLAFNPAGTTFAAKPSFIAAMLDELDEYNAASTSAPLGMGNVDDLTLIDHLAANAAAQPGEQSARSALWQGVFALENLYLVPHGELRAPLAILHESGPAVLLFTTAERAAAFGAGYADGTVEPGSVVAVPTTVIVQFIEQLAEQGITQVQVDPDHGAFLMTPPELRPTYIRVTGRQPGQA